MPNPGNLRHDLVVDTVKKFGHLPIRTIARHLIASHGDMFDQDLEKARFAVRIVLGKMGDKNRTNASTKDLYRKPGDLIKLPRTWRRKRTPYNLSPGLWGILADLHIPYHEPVPIESAIKHMQNDKVDGIFLNGDIMDASAISYWKSTQRRDFNREVGDCLQFFDFLRQEFPTQKIVYKPGNHEYRLPNLFAEKMPELIETPLVAWETIMGFEEREIEFLDYFQIVNAGKLPILHGHEIRSVNRSVNAARGLFLKAKTWAMCAHCHSTSQHTTRSLKGDMLTTWSIGCLCDLEPDYNPYGNDWNWGFAYVNVEKSGGFEVLNYRVLPKGKVV